jgi:hypothetical protein
MKSFVCSVLVALVLTAVDCRPVPTVKPIQSAPGTTIRATTILTTTTLPPSTPVPTTTAPLTPAVVPKSTVPPVSSQEVFDLEAEEAADHTFMNGAIARGPLLMCPNGELRDHSGRCKPTW